MVHKTATQNVVRASTEALGSSGNPLSKVVFRIEIKPSLVKHAANHCGYIHQSVYVFSSKRNAYADNHRQKY